jgi:hypothetical protein
MRWKVRPEPPQPPDGDKKRIEWFAFLPYRVGDWWVWMEWVTAIAIYDKTFGDYRFDHAETREQRNAD